MLISRTLSEIVGAEVWLKFENLQFTAAYKERGALNKLLQLTEEERARGVIAASAGNHAQAVAYHAKRLGIPAAIVMPAATPTVKVTQTEGHGAQVILYGPMFDEAHAKARELALEEGYVFVHPFDDPQVIAGAGTPGLELLEDAPDLDAIVVPIGGGGLLSGVSIASRAIKPDIELIGVEAELYPSMKCAVEGCNLPLGGDTLAEGIAVKEPGRLTAQILSELVNDIMLVPERDLERAVAMLVGIEKTVVEGAAPRALPRCFRILRVSPVRRSRRSCAAAISTRTCSPTCWSATWCGKAGSRGCALQRTISPARSPRSPPRSTRPASTSSRSTTAGSSPGYPPRTR